MNNFDETVKSLGGAVAFIELNDDSVWQVGIKPHKSTENIENIEIPDTFYKYSIYVNVKTNITFVESYGYIELPLPKSIRYYGTVISEELLPLGKVEVLCYKKTEGIEEFPYETNGEEIKCHI